MFFCTPYPVKVPECALTPLVVRTLLDMGAKLFWNPYTDKEEGEVVLSREDPKPGDMLFVLLW